MIKKTATLLTAGVFIVVSSVFSQDSEIFQKGLQAEANLKHEDAVTLFTQALNQDGESVAALNHLSYNLAKSSEAILAKAYMHLQKSLIKDRKNEVALQQLGLIYITQGKLDKAHEILSQLKKMESTEAELLQEKLNHILNQAKQISATK